jgi:NAD-dependent deacetylase
VVNTPQAALPERAAALLAGARAGAGRVVVLTGAGISAASGIPTFRSPGGYWRVGSVDYRPEELATLAAFTRMPAEQWGWYLHRRAVCAAAQPNAAHHALVGLERALGDRFLLVTQNVDGLHLRAGHGRARVYEIHGSLASARCSSGCSPPRELPPEFAAGWPRDRVPDDRETLAALHCAACGAWLRPHVLWFDECYDEAHFRADSALRAVDGAALLFVIGTSGATTLPARMVHGARARRVPLLVVDPESGPFGAIAQTAANGVFVQGTATACVPAIATALGAA